MLEESVKSTIENQHIDKMDFNFLNSTYKKAFEDACARYPILASGPGKNWKVSTYGRKVREEGGQYRSMLGGIKPMEPCVSQRNASVCRFS